MRNHKSLILAGNLNCRLCKEGRKATGFLQLYKAPVSTQYLLLGSTALRRALASSITDAHSSLSTAFCRFP